MPELWCDYCNRGAEGCLHPVPVYLVTDGVPILRMTRIPRDDDA